MNQLFYGDNLDVIRDHLPDDSVDLIYLDPPFNSRRAYNLIFRDKRGEQAASQIEAFEDTWTWTEQTAWAFDEIMSRPDVPLQLKTMMNAFRIQDWFDGKLPKLPDTSGTLKDAQRLIRALERQAKLPGIG